MSRHIVWNVWRGGCSHVMPALLLATILFPIVGSSVIADNLDWTTAVDGNFSDAGNWTVTSGAGPPPPGVGDRASFDVNGTYTVTFTQNEQSDDLRARGSNVTFLSDSGAVRTYDVTTGVAASRSNWICGSSSTFTPARRVLPKAVIFA